MSEHAAGLDLSSAADGPIDIAPNGGRAAVPTGLALEIPVSFEGQVRPRSGLARKAGVTILNAPGTIDADYRGEIVVLLVNLGHEPYTINSGDRIAQLVIAPVTRGDFEEATELSTTDRATEASDTRAETTERARVRRRGSVSAIVGIDRFGSGTRPADNGFYRSGEVIAGRYIVRELIGVGPLGMVYRSENRQSGGVVALRVVWPDLLTDDASRGRFLKECIRARTVQNRYVAPLYEAFIDDTSGQTVCILAVKHLGGPTLASRVARRLQAGVPLLALEAQPIVSQIGVGLSAIHQAGLVHGNLRPSSIYFAGDEVRVSDLGVASALPAEIVALAEQHAGQASGRSPEAAAGRRSSPASDVYAFAHLTGQMLGLLEPALARRGSRAALGARRADARAVAQPRAIATPTSTPSRARW